MEDQEFHLAAYRLTFKSGREVVLFEFWHSAYIHCHLQALKLQAEQQKKNIKLDIDKE